MLLDIKKIIVLFLLMFFSPLINAKNIDFKYYIEQYEYLFLEKHDNENTHILMSEIESDLKYLEKESVETQLRIREMFSEYSYYFGFLDKLKFHAEKGQELSKKNNNKEIEIFYYYIAVYHNYNGDNIELVEKYYNQAIKYSLLNENKDVLFSSYLELGELYSYINNVYKAFTYYKKAEQSAVTKTDYIHVLLGISSIFYYLDIHELAMEYLKKMEMVIETAEKLSVPKEDFYLYIYQIYASIYLEKKDFETSKNYLDKYIKIVEYQNDINFTIRAYLEYANFYITKGDFDNALLYIKESEKLMFENKDEVLFTNKYNYRLAAYNYFYKTNKFEEAKQQLSEIKDELIEEGKKGYEKISKDLASVNNKLGNFKEALEDQRRYNEYYISSRDKKETTLGLFLNESYKEQELVFQQKRLNRINYEKAKEIIEINKEILNKNKNLMINSTVTFIFFLSLILYFYYYKITKKISEKADLVDCYNRGYAVSLINKFIKNKNKFKLFLLDVDHFKQINDTYGHDKGDEILIKISEIIKSELHKDACLARVGGEEFMIIEKLKNNLIDIEEIRKKIENYNFFEDRKVTASFGCFENENDNNFDIIYKKLDDKLYEAKRTGRNKVVY